MHKKKDRIKYHRYYPFILCFVYLKTTIFYQKSNFQNYNKIFTMSYLYIFLTSNCISHTLLFSRVDQLRDTFLAALNTQHLHNWTLCLTFFIETQHPKMFLWIAISKKTFLTVWYKKITKIKSQLWYSFHWK